MTMYLIGALVRAWHRMSRGGLRPSERRRQRSIAALAARHADAIPAADVALVEAHHELITKWRTDEQPVIEPVRRRTVMRRPARWQRVAAARVAVALDRAADPLRGPLRGPLAAPVVLSSVRFSEPAPWHLESFTTGWTRAEMDALVAEAKAMAGR